MLEGFEDDLVGLPENGCIHREMYLSRTPLIWEQEDPLLTQGCHKCLDVNPRVELEGEDVRAMCKVLHLDPLALIETVNECSAFSHGSAKSFYESLNALQGERCRKTRRCQTPAKHASLVVEASEAFFCSYYNSPERRPEILVEGDIHCIKVGGILLRADTGCSGHHIQPRPIQVGRNALRLAVAGDRYHILVGHDLAVLATYRTLDHDSAYRAFDPTRY